jgi:uncharacterized integral membrane protein (TIGR00698 family)
MSDKKTVVIGEKPGFTEDQWALMISGILIAFVLANTFIPTGLILKAPVYSWSGDSGILSSVFKPSNLISLFVLACFFAFFAFLATGSKRIFSHFAGFLLLFLLGIVSLIIAGHKTISSYGVEYVVFALLIGLLLRNAKLAPAWLIQVARSEMYIKTGLVILGTSVLFTDIIKAGLPGILQAILVVLVVWFVSMWISKMLKVDDEFAVMIASAVSICGVSAAIVASGAIQGDKKKLSYVTTLVLLVAIPMLIIQPWIIKYFNIPEIIGGAWLGGTLDTTASVTAASQLVGPIAMKAGVIVKFSQNVLIGFAALFIATWWAYKTKTEKKSSDSNWKIIWDRFPKFVLGFIVASLLFSFIIPTDTTRQVSGFLNGLRTLWFAIAFVSIGLEADFKALFSDSGTKPAYSFVLSQLFNIIWTLIWAYILFGGYLLAVPDLN